MRVGLSLSSTSFDKDPFEGAQAVIERARAANEAKLDLLSLGDHHLTPINYFQNVPMLARLLAEWDSGPVGCLFLLPLWNPVLVAEQVGTLAALTKSTFVIQTGVGDGEAIFEAMGTSTKTRGADIEESIATIQDLFAGNGMNGNPDLHINPVPTQKIEWWIGASTSKAGIRRAAALGDAWYAAPFLNPRKAKELLNLYRQYCREYGKEPRPIIRKDVIVLNDGVKAKRLGEKLIEKGYRGMRKDDLIIGSPEQAPEQLQPFQELGFTDLTCRCMTIPQEEAIETINLLGEVKTLLNS